MYIYGPLISASKIIIYVKLEQIHQILNDYGLL